MAADVSHPGGHANHGGPGDDLRGGREEEVGDQLRLHGHVRLCSSPPGVVGLRVPGLVWEVLDTLLGATRYDTSSTLLSQMALVNLAVPVYGSVCGRG